MADGLRILITGASTGFGKLTAETLGRAGHRVFAGLRDPRGRNAAASANLLEKAKGQLGTIEIVDLDVTSDASVDAAVALMDRNVGGIDVVVNNAGVVTIGVTETFTVEQTRAIFEVNVVGVQRVNRAALPLVRRGKGGLLVHVSSVLGRYVIPGLGVYTASKYALEALVECYHYELAPQGIEAVIVQPGTYPTSIMANMVSGADETRGAAYGSLVDRFAGMRAMLESLPKSENAPNPQDVADAILRLVSAAPGTRPLRTVVDPQGGAWAKALNTACDQVQEQLLGAVGMADLLQIKV